MPRARPLWRAAFVTGLTDGQVALVVVLHHVLADGIGGLAVLSGLTDGAIPGPREPAGPALARGRPLTEAAVTRWRHKIAGIPRAFVGLRTAAAEFGAGRPTRAPRSSLNAPTGPRRQLATVEIELETLQAAAHRRDATVNDALLAAVTGALHVLLRHRGERVPALVVSVPVSARAATTTGDLGNHVGVMRVRVPVTDPAGSPLAEIATITRHQKTTTRGASAALVEPVFRVLAATGAIRWYVNRQRLVNVFLTDIPGPPSRLRLNGTEITHVVPLMASVGNVSVAFAALSYAGSLTITVIVDPDLVPDLTILTTALERQLQTLARPA
jgi:WS/DGAT/MGAT family acyltransferase